LLVQQVAKRAARGIILRVEASPIERASRNASEPDLASLHRWRVASPPMAKAPTKKHNAVTGSFLPNPLNRGIRRVPVTEVKAPTHKNRSALTTA